MDIIWFKGASGKLLGVIWVVSTFNLEQGSTVKILEGRVDESVWHVTSGLVS